MNPWPPQVRAVDETLAAREQGHRMIVTTLPTGGGKSFVMQLLAEHELRRRGKVVLYTNRKMLTDQTSDVFMDAGIYHGVRAAGYEDEREHPFQIASIQTEYSRVIKRKTWALHEATLVLVDECHQQKEQMACAILAKHKEQGVPVVGLTATPVGLAGLYEHLIVAGTNSELRACGALVEAHHFGPDEPDLRAFKKLRESADPSALTEPDIRKAMMVPGIFGRVWGSFESLNPAHLPTILFAPGVQESVWFAEQFTAKGVKAAHIDGEDVWVEGEWHSTSRTVRDQVLADSKSGRIVVLCNRFVLREGINAPWLRHCIFATVFGSLQSLLQPGGRVLRADNDPLTVGRFGPKEFAVVQDHGGNFWRWGSLNEDREWHLEDTSSSLYGVRADRIRQGKQKEPFTCPQCHRVWTQGKVCSPARGGCGHVLDSTRRSRMVVGTDGTLKPLGGEIFKPRRTSRNPEGPQLWERMYYRSRTEKGRRTFAAAMALWASENNWSWPDRRWPFMPTSDLDVYRLVEEVPRERLT
jgi:superfamily II DNA or RNA helicase